MIVLYHVGIESLFNSSFTFFMFKNIVLVGLGCAGGAIIVLGMLTLLYPEAQTRAPLTSTDGTVLLSYSAPSSAEIAIVAGIEIPADSLLTEGLETVLIQEGMSEAYVQALNETVTKVISVEEQFKSRVLVEMTSLQASAASGNYVDLFRYMAQTKSEIAEAKVLLLDLEGAVDAFQSEFLETPLMPDVQDATVIYIDHLRAHISVGLEAVNALDATLSGKVPTLSQMSEVERLQNEYNAGVVIFAQKLEKLRALIEAKV